MTSRLAAAALLAALAGCGAAGGDGEPPTLPDAGEGRGALYEFCGDDATCGCAERCELSGKYFVCNGGPVRPDGAPCSDSGTGGGTCVGGTCCLVTCAEDSLACTQAACTPDAYTCAQVVNCPALPCFGAGVCGGGGECDYSGAYLGEGIGCGTGLWCYQQLCRPGCFISGQYWDPGASNPLNGCKVCDPTATREGWTELPDASACGAGKVCAAGGCVDGCLIEAALRTLGERNPVNECQACTASHPDHWADTTDFCSDDGDPCTLDRCAAGACTHPRNSAACRPPGTDSMFGCGSAAGGGPIALLLAALALCLARTARRRAPRGGIAALVALALAAGPILAAAAPPPRARPAADPDAVAIVTLVAGAGITEETARFVTQALGAELHARGLPTISQEDVRAALGFEKERQALGCDAAGCFAELGSSLGVRRLVTGSLARLGDSLVFDLRLVDVAAGGAPRRHAVRRPASRGDDAFLEAIPELVEALFPREAGAEPRGRLALVAGGWLELDRDPGGAALVALRWSLSPSLRTSAGLIATPHRLGASASLGWIPWNAGGRLRPVASLELMLLAADPLSPGVGLSAGVEWRATPRLDLALQLPLVRLFAVADGMRETYPFAALTAAWSL